mmetsp:Transcript_25974/g.78242  ORF Transcript_25974/g.78242 Transcript_25974/m.78242 type:complete len:250 (-) Transcript_25974:733-1482(-)
MDAILLRPQRLRAGLRGDGQARGDRLAGQPAPVRHPPTGDPLPDVHPHDGARRHPVEPQRPRLADVAASLALHAGLVPHHVQKARLRHLAVERRAVGPGFVVRERPCDLLVHAEAHHETRAPLVLACVLRGALVLVGGLLVVVVPRRRALAGTLRLQVRDAAMFCVLRRLLHLPRLARHAPRVRIWDRDGPHLRPDLHEGRRGRRARDRGHAAAGAGSQPRAVGLPPRVEPRLLVLRPPRIPRGQEGLP